MIAVVIVVIILVATKTSEPVCELQAERPNIDSTKTKAISSKENNALLKFAGYVKYKLDPDSEDRNAFLELSETRSVALKDGNSVIFKMDCATITIHLNLDFTANLIGISSVTMELVKPADEYYACSMAFGTVYPKGKHYSCKIENSYPCRIITETDTTMGQNITVATLTVTNLEFEINGNAAKVKKGQFSTEPAECSELANNS